MTPLEQQYRRLIRWYSRGWRRHNGEALLGVMLDAAEAEHRDSPTAAERATVRTRGLLDRAQAMVPYALVTVVLLCLVLLISLLRGGVGIFDRIIIYGAWIPGWAFYLGCSVVAGICLIASIATFRRRATRMRWARRSQNPSDPTGQSKNG